MKEVSLKVKKTKRVEIEEDGEKRINYVTELKSSEGDNFKVVVKEDFESSLDLDAEYILKEKTTQKKLPSPQEIGIE